MGMKINNRALRENATRVKMDFATGQGKRQIAQVSACVDVVEFISLLTPLQLLAIGNLRLYQISGNKPSKN